MVVEGILEKTPEGVKQPVELKVAEVKFVGSCDPAKYPIAKVCVGVVSERCSGHN